MSSRGRWSGGAAVCLPLSASRHLSGKTRSAEHTNQLINLCQIWTKVGGSKEVQKMCEPNIHDLSSPASPPPPPSLISARSQMMFGGNYWALPAHNTEVILDCGQSWLKSLLLCDCMTFCRRKMRLFGEDRWCSELLFLHYLMKDQQSPPDRLNKCIRGKGWRFSYAALKGY